MPELPEVEVTRRALTPSLKGKRFVRADFRCEKLRRPVPDLAPLAGMTLVDLSRRAKHLVWRFETNAGAPRWLVTHLGMSGSWRLWPASELPAAGPHDRADLVFEGVVARLTDQRKFSDMTFSAVDPLTTPPLSKLGVEPLSADFTPEGLWQGLLATRREVKSVLMDGKVVVGCGNIYANESLFEAGISPEREACSVTQDEAAKLHDAIVDVLTRAVAAGGTTLRDFHGADGGAGWFAVQCAVYGREGETCPQCGSVIRRVVQRSRSTFFCPRCQK